MRSTTTGGEDAIVEGKIQRLQRFVKLAELDDRYRAKADVRPLLAEKLSALNEGRTDARGTLTLALFVAEFYEPYARENLKPSTVNGYTKLWDVLARVLARFGFETSKQWMLRTCLQPSLRKVFDAVHSNTQSPC